MPILGIGLGAITSGRVDVATELGNDRVDALPALAVHPLGGERYTLAAVFDGILRKLHLLQTTKQREQYQYAFTRRHALIDRQMPLERSGSDLDPIAWPPARPLRQLHAAAAFALPQGVDDGIGNDGRTLAIENEPGDADRPARPRPLQLNAHEQVIRE